MADKITPADITRRIGAIDAKLTSLQYEAEGLSFASVSGDLQATEALDAITRQQDTLRAERELLDNAKAEANRIERSEYQAISDVHTRNQRIEVKRIIEEMRVVAKHLDKAYTDLVYHRAAMLELEGQIRKPVQFLGMRTDGRVGQGTLSEIAVNRVAAIGRRDFSDDRSVSDMLESAWHEVIAMEVE